MQCDGACIRRAWMIVLLATSKLDGVKEYSADNNSLFLLK